MMRDRFNGGTMSSHAWIAALVIVGGVLVPVPASSQMVDQNAPVVALPEARRRATSVDPNAVAARSQVATASWERRAAWTDVLTPRVTAGGSYTHFSEPFFNFGTGTVSPNATAATLE